MLERSPSPDAARARSSRARLKVGVRTYRVRAHSRRLVAASAIDDQRRGVIDMPSPLQPRRVN
jgi:hypothetical protein